MSHGPFERGDIVWMSFDPQKGHEQAGTRPALVISTSNHNRNSAVILVCPITSRKTNWPFAVNLTGSGRISGSVLVDHVRSVDWRSRRPVFAEKCPPDVLAHATGKLAALIGAT